MSLVGGINICILFLVLARFAIGLLVPLKPGPQKRILVPLRGSFKNSDEHPLSFFYGIPQGAHRGFINSSWRDSEIFTSESYEPKF